MSDTLIEALQTEGRATLFLTGDVDLSSVGALEEAASEALSGHPQGLVIDVSGVTFLTSSVLGSLLRIQSAAREQGTMMTLREPTPIVQRLLRLSGLDTVLPVGL